MNKLEALSMIRDGVDALIALETPQVEPAPVDPAPVDPAPVDPVPVPVDPVTPAIPPPTLIADKDALWKASQAAKGGEVFLLAPGVWSGILIRGVKGATFRGQPGVIIKDLNVQGSGDLTFEDLECFVEQGGTGDPLKFTSVAGLTLRGLYVHSEGDDPAKWVSGCTIRNCTDVAVLDGRWDRLANAVQYLDNDRIQFADNRFTNIRMDGIRGGGNSNVVIERNHFTDFRPLTGRKGFEDDHGDAIQVWTSNTTKSAENIQIRDNVVVQGEGGAVQGIFATMQTSHRYKNVEISDNLIIGGLTNAIMVTGADGVLIARNAVAAVGAKSWIRLENLTGLALTDNQSTDYYKAGKVEVVAEANNTKLPAVIDGGAALLASRRVV
jgi:hypothetical protein